LNLNIDGPVNSLGKVDHPDTCVALNIASK
jgi:hypothetical protein